MAEGIFCIRQPYITIVQAAGKYRETRNGAMFEAIINLGVSLILVQIVGLNGVIIGTLVANVFRTMQYAYFSSKQLLNRSIFKFVKKVLWHIGNSAGSVLIYFSILGMISVTNWTEWILHGMATFIITLSVTTLSGLVLFRKELISSFVLMKKMIFGWSKR